MSEPKHLCPACRYVTKTVPAEVLIETSLPDGTTGTVNVAEELKFRQSLLVKVYKHVHYCPQLKAIVVGGDSPTQMRKECPNFVTK